MTSRLRFGRRTTIVLSIILLSAALPIRAQIPPDAKRRLCYTEHAIHLLQSRKDRGEFLNIAALNDAYKDSLRKGKKLRRQEVSEHLRIGSQQIAALNDIVQAVSQKGEPPVQPVGTLDLAAPYLAKASLDLIFDAIVSTPGDLIIAAGPARTTDASGAALDSSDAVNALGARAIMEALHLGGNDPGFQRAFDGYYGSLLQVQTTSTPEAIIAADSTLPQPNLSDPSLNASQLIVLFDQVPKQNEDMPAFLDSLRKFVSEHTQSVVDRSTTAMNAGIPTDQATRDAIYKTVTSDVDNAKSTATIVGDLLYFSGTSTDQKYIDSSIDALKITDDVASLLFLPAPNPLALSADVLNSTKDLLASLGSGNVSAATVKQLAAIQKQVAILQANMTTQFNIVDAKLDQILATLRTELGKIEASQARIEDGIALIDSQLSVVAGDVAYIDLDLSAKLAALANEMTALNIDTCLNFSTRFPSEEMGSEVFNRCASAFHTAAVSDSRDQLHAGSHKDKLPVPSDLLDTDSAALLHGDLLDPFTKLDLVASINDLLVSGAAESGAQLVPSVTDWAAGAISYLRLLNQSFLLRGTANVTSDLDEIKGTGDDIQAAALSITTVKDVSDRPGLVAAARTYLESIMRVRTALDNIEKLYRMQNGITKDLEAFDLWGPPLQDTAFSPPAASIPAYWSGVAAMPAPVFKLPVSPALLHRILPPALRNALQAGIITTTYTWRADTSFRFGVDGYTIPPCLYIVTAVRLSNLPSTVTATKWQQMVSYGVDYRTHISNALCSNSWPSDAGLTPYDQTMATFLANNWLPGSAIENKFISESTFEGGDFDISQPNFMRHAKTNPNLGLAAQGVALGVSSGVVSDFLEQTMDFHRAQMAIAVQHALSDPGSELTTTLQLVTNSKQILIDLIAVGLSTSLEGGPHLSNLLNGSSAIKGGDDIRTLISTAFGRVSTSRSAELDSFMQANGQLRADLLQQWMNHEGVRVVTGGATAADISGMKEYYAKVTDLPLPTNNVRVFMDTGIKLNDAALNNLQDEVLKDVSAAPGGEPIRAVQNLIDAIKIARERYLNHIFSSVI
jgi:hypothetical protein